ncbi:MAG TPA: hypothetical protein VGM39_23465 [Kofleriaceae bacterium]|jgi:hypothetical protein
MNAKLSLLLTASLSLLSTAALADDGPSADLTDHVCNGLLDAHTPKAPASCKASKKRIVVKAKSKITSFDGKTVTAGAGGFTGYAETTCGDDGSTTTITGDQGSVIVVDGATWKLKEAFSCKATTAPKSGK